MSQVVRPNAIVDPRAMAKLILVPGADVFVENLLVMFRHTASTASAMFASQRPPRQAKYTKVLVVEFPLVKKLGDDGSLLVPTA